MTGTDLLPASVLRRKAVVYVRQSTQQQVQLHAESTRGVVAWIRLVAPEAGPE